MICGVQSVLDIILIYWFQQDILKNIKYNQIFIQNGKILNTLFQNEHKISENTSRNSEKHCLRLRFEKCWNSVRENRIVGEIRWFMHWNNYSITYLFYRERILLRWIFLRYQCLIYKRTGFQVEQTSESSNRPGLMLG